MSVSPDFRPTLRIPALEPLGVSSLSGIEGELMVVKISIEPRLLEKLLDALARLDFPINPQIYHDAALVYVNKDGSRRIEPTTTVEFPVYRERLSEVKAALQSWEFHPGSLAARSLLEDITSEFDVRPAPAGASYDKVIWYRQAAGAQQSLKVHAGHTSQ